MTSLPRFSVHNPVLVNIAMMALLVGGVATGLTLTREMFPEFSPNRIVITTPYPGASPSEVEKGITLKIEEAIKSIEGIEKIESLITEGRSTITAKMRSGFDEIDQAVDDVKAAVDSIPRDDFPEEALETQVFKLDPRWPVIDVSLYGVADGRTLKLLGDRLRDDILALPEITDVELSGLRKDEISVEVTPDKLIEYGVSFLQVGDAIVRSNMDLPAGQIKTADANVAVRTLGQKDWGEDLYDIIVTTNPGGGVVRLRDVATIVDGFEDVDLEGRFNGSPAATVIVYKTSEQDAIEIAGMVKAMVAGKLGRRLERPWMERLIARLSGRDKVQEVYDNARNDPYPPGVRLQTHSDLSRFIEGRLDLLKRNGIWGGLLVFLTLFLLLHWRVALWVMMGLLLAICGALILMSSLGLTLNLMTAFGLIIVLGLLVDDAIIVAENVYSKVEQGVDPKLAAIEGSEEVTWPVICAILPTIVAFLPLMYIEGQIGDWMGVLPVVVCVALTVSLVEAFSILPSHLAHGIKPVVQPGSHPDDARPGARNGLGHRFRLAQERFVKGFLITWYERFVRLATRYRYVTVASLVAAMMVVAGLVGGGHVPFVFLQKMDSETILAKVEMGIGAPIKETRRAVTLIERAALQLNEHQSVHALVGAQLNSDLVGGSRRSHVAQLFIELCPAEQRERSSIQIIQELRDKTANIRGARRLNYTPLEGGPGGAPIHLEISGQHLDELAVVAEHFKRRLAGFEGVYDIVDDFDAGRRELQIELFDSGRTLGLTTESLAWQVRSAFYGFEARKIQRNREDVKIMVRYPPEQRQAVYDVESMYIATPTGAMVPFSEVACLSEGTGFATIRRTDQRRTITVFADVDEEVSNSEKVIASLGADFDELRREHPGLHLQFGGRKLETSKAFGSLKKSFLIALGLIYVILAGLFRSYIQPVIIMVAIPFGLVGAVVGHWIVGFDVTLLSMFGMVALAGIVVNDSLVLIDRINRNVRAGGKVYESAESGARTRFRPIILTTVTTVAGMTPLLFERSFQAQFLKPMAISIAFGLLFATMLTLLVVPSLYLIGNDFRRVFRWLWTGNWVAPEAVAQRDEPTPKPPAAE